MRLRHFEPFETYPSVDQFLLDQFQTFLPNRQLIFNVGLADYHQPLYEGGIWITNDYIYLELDFTAEELR